MPNFGFASTRRILQHRVEYRLKLAGRARDHLEDFGSRRLLVQGFRELTRARLHLVEQPHVRDRDHRLVGEGLEQLNLGVREDARLPPRDEDGSDDLPLADHRHPEAATIATRLSGLFILVLRNRGVRPERERRHQSGSRAR